MIAKFMFTALFILAFVPGIVRAEKIPQDFSNVEYFYVFGPQGDPLMGADDGRLELFIDIKSDEPEPLSIAIFDPDTGGKKDWLDPRDKTWDTVTKFTVYGQTLLEEEVIAQENDYQYITFGPYAKEQGLPVEGVYRFRVVVETISGNDANLFKFKLSPDSVEAFSYKITFRLAPNFGDKMYFYPQIAAGTRYISVENFDLDRNGGTSIIYDPVARRLGGIFSGAKYNIKSSRSGQWQATEISLADGPARRLEYIVTKKTQRNAHAGLRLRDKNATLLPIYFKKNDNVRLSPVKSRSDAYEKPCNTFTFDASDSYDSAKTGLSFLWNFGDGHSSNEAVVEHTFQQAGEFTVTLTVVDGSDLECDTAITAQTVKVNLPPKAGFTAGQSACLKEDIIFDAGITEDSETDSLSYYWDFGDGSKAEGVRVVKNYARSGEYEVVLSVDDNQQTSCSRDSVKKSIRINSAPRALAGKDIDMCLDSFNDEFNIIFDGSKSSDPDQDPLLYSWDFGDGVKGEGKTVTHRYTQSGIYTAVLSVDDQTATACAVARDQIKISLNKRPGASAGENKSLCLNDPVEFRGTTGSQNEDNFSFSWDFGDGQRQQGKSHDYKYKKGGLYKVIFAVDDNRGTPCSTSSDIINVDVNTAPLAKLQSVKPVCIGQAVAFDASASYDSDGDTLVYRWDFGDGNTKIGREKITHIYAKGGSYSVGVTVDDGKGRGCSIDRDVVACKVNTAPVADAGENFVCCEGKIAHFDGSGSYDPDGDELEYYWNFGDGTSAKGQKVSHTYQASGVYNVILTVDDSTQTPCSTASAGFEATVKAAPVPVIKVR